MKFRKKPIVIEAMQFTDESVGEVYAWLMDHEVDFEDGGVALTIKTLEGDMTASPGDWIIRGVQGEFYPCKPDIFEMTYEKEYAVSIHAAEG